MDKMQTENGYGVLFIVATPIGNARDMSQRGMDILEGVDVIAAEDTRRSVVLLNKLGIRNKLIEKHHAAPGVLRGDHVHALQDIHAPLGHIPGVADGRGHDEQHAVTVFGLHFIHNLSSRGQLSVLSSSRPCILLS